MPPRFEDFAEQLERVQQAFEGLIRAAEVYRDLAAEERSGEEAKVDANPKRAGLFNRAVLETEDLIRVLETGGIDALVRMVDRLEMIRAAYESDGMIRIGMIHEGPPASNPEATR